MVRVRCVHGDVVKYPVVLLAIQFRGQKHNVEVAVKPHLRHLLILETNWPAFKVLLGVLCVDASCGKEKPGREAEVRTGEAEPGPAEAAPGERNAVKRLILMERDDFPLEQSQDESLRNAFDQVRSIDGQPLQSARPPSYSYFAILKDRLYRVTQDAQSKQDTTQLLVPKSHREMLFQAAHCNPMAGHLGQAATLNRLMTRFFLAGHSRECTPVVCGLSWMSVSESPGLPKSVHGVFPLRAPVWAPAPWGLGRPEGDLGGGTFGEQKRNSACAGPENKTPHLGAALHGECVTGAGQAKPAIQSDYAILHREIKNLYCSPLLALNYSPSGKDLSRSHGG